MAASSYSLWISNFGAYYWPYSGVAQSGAYCNGVVGIGSPAGKSIILFAGTFTEAADALTATLAARIATALSATEGVDSFTATALARVALSATLPEGADTSAMAGTVALTITVTLTEGADGLLFAETVHETMVGGGTDEPDVLTGNLVEQIPVLLAAIEDADTFEAAAVAIDAMMAALTEGADSLSAVLIKPGLATIRARACLETMIQINIEELVVLCRAIPLTTVNLRVRALTDAELSAEPETRVMLRIAA